MLAIPLQAPTPLVGSGYSIALEESLKSERRLLLDLLGVLECQRSGVAGDDISAVDDSVFAAQRVLRTLAESRRRRRSLLDIIVGEPDASLSALDDVMGDAMTLSLRTARDELLETAQTLARELERNRQILRGAIASGDKLIRTLTGAPQTPVVYSAPGAKPDAGGNLLVNRQV